jgi:long-chain acyl-CoA synthetase
VAKLLTNESIQSGGNRFARALDRLGLPPGGAVACLLGNRPEFLHVYRGVTWSGRRLTPMSWRWSLPDIDYVVDNCEARVLVADARFPESAGAAAARIPEAARFAVGGSIPGFRSWDQVNRESGAPMDAPVAGECMLYTSGTTGRPKGVLRTGAPAGPPPGSFGRAGAAMLQAFLREGEVPGTHLVAAPLYHAGPLTYCDGAALLGSDVVLMERFDAEGFLGLVEAHRIASTFLVPTQFVRLLRLPVAVRRRYDLSSLRLVCHGAAPVGEQTKRAMIEWLGPVLFEFYGGTEGGGCMIGSQEWLERPGSVGRPRPGVEVQILDEEGRPLPPRREGGVYFNLEATPFAYKDDPGATAEGRRGDLFTLGDVGYLDEDGYLFLCDRRADVIVTGGVNVYPAQIEAVLLELPFIADCCVVGAPDEEWGESVRAILQLESTTDSGLTEIEARVLEHCRERLAPHQLPRGIDLHPALPRTETGKLARQALRAPYWRDRARRI